VQFFVIGHDCAHKSFSKNKLIEDIVGTVMFMPLIYPYEPWRFKHDRHHARPTCEPAPPLFAYPGRYCRTFCVALMFFAVPLFSEGHYDHMHVTMSRAYLWPAACSSCAFRPVWSSRHKYCTVLLTYC